MSEIDSRDMPKEWRDFCLANTQSLKLMIDHSLIANEDDLSQKVDALAGFMGLDAHSRWCHEACMWLRDQLGIPPAGGTIKDLKSGIEISAKRKYRRPWLREAQSSGAFHENMWMAYKRLLITEKNRSLDVVAQLDRVTADLLDLLPDPRDGAVPATAKGLVIGDVQSGKTQTYMALMNRAADYGYKFFVILTSDNERLRRQTQERVDSDFIGIRADAVRRSDDLSVLTSDEEDFNKKGKQWLSQVPHPRRGNNNIFVAVLKKNQAVLRAFQEWVTSGNTDPSVPMLIIDDESDYASINTGKIGSDPSTINKLVSQLLDDSSCRGYVAVTATPFANIFIDDEENKDLFPEDFIYELDSPDSYLGASQLFGDLDHSSELQERFGNDTIQTIDQEEMESWLGLQQTKYDRLGGNGLDAQLEFAINTFIVACALEDPEGIDNSQRSMLIHVSRFVDVQRQVADRVYAYVDQLRQVIKRHADDPMIDKLHDAYNREYKGLRGKSWEDVRSRLRHYLGLILVRLENNSSAEWNESHGVQEGGHPEYSIYVGGNSLSRGMTLPGLSVSFFYRKVGAADTLLQMGRWFGYRQGYEDLLRIWLLPETIHDFRYSAQVIEDLRGTVERMHRNGMTPKQFGIMIRKNPENGVRVTSAVKSRNAVVRKAGEDSFRFNIAGTNIESTKLSYDSNVVRRNDLALSRLISSAQKLADEHSASVERTSARSSVVYQNVPAQMIADFLADYRAGEEDHYFGNVVYRYRNATTKADFSIAQQYALTQALDTKWFPQWDVVVETSGKGPDLGSVVANPGFVMPFEWKMTRRQCTILDVAACTMAVSGRSLRLAGPTDVRDYIAKFGDVPAYEQSSLFQTDKTLGETCYYQFAERPALFLYMINPVSPQKEPRQIFEMKGIRHSPAAKIVVPTDEDSLNPDVNNGKGAVYWNTVQQRNYREHLSQQEDTLRRLIERGDSDSESEED